MIEIRQLRPDDDLRDLLPLSRALFAEYARHDPFFAIDTLRDEDITAFFAGTLNTDDGATYVALDGAAIVGYMAAFIREQASMYVIKRVGSIAGLMVRPEYRRQGIASRLLAAVHAWMRARGVEYVTLYTSVNNQAALGFYQRHGMRPLQTVLVGRLEPPAPEAGQEE